MYSKDTRPKQNSSNPVHATTPSRFAAPKFFVQPQVEPLTPEQEQVSKEEIEKIKAAGSNWPDVSMFTTNRPAPAPHPRVQRKRDTAKTGNKDAQAPSESNETNQSNIIKPVKNSVPQLRDYMASDKTDYDPSLLSDAEIRATEEYRYLEQKFVSSPSEKPENIYSQEEILFACRLALRYMRQTQFLINFKILENEFLPKARKQLNVANLGSKITKEEGLEMTWVESDKTKSPSVFRRWVSASSESDPTKSYYEEPPFETATMLNCWEAILLIAYKAGMITWKWIHDIYTTETNGPWTNYLIEKLSGSSRIIYEVDNPNSPKPLRGDIVFFDTEGHIAMANGSTKSVPITDPANPRVKKTVDGIEIISFWPPPDKKMPTEEELWNNPGTVDKIKMTTIEELSDYLKEENKGYKYYQQRIEFATAPW